ncbi:MAG TPA: heme exporter protein CcmD [Geminicoccus sp.]|uniref:heme exporter protein CcmD n=1 Tax=Geminicoccus sp. TaxID=2024832 RepID=UPI002CD808B7|nr:heme exporter protein CcmD [Geminicoccus sp.]HWL69058.1 heme exporter protein CcmD [Geminicoccus sp.]
MAEFLAMGGYAAYVWPAFGFTILVLAGLWILSLRQMRAKEAELEALRSQMRARRPARRQEVIRPRRASATKQEG